MCVLIHEAGSTRIYSVQSSVRDHRCLVTIEGRLQVCEKDKCKQNRAVHLAGDNDQPFSCKHIELTANAERSSFLSVLDESKISTYPCDADTKDHLRKCIRPGFPAVVQVSEGMYAVYGTPSASTPLGFCHVKKNETGRMICSSKECRKASRNTKTAKTRLFCMHVNILCCVLGQQRPTDYQHISEETEHPHKPNTNTGALVSSPSTSSQARQVQTSETAATQTPTLKTCGDDSKNISVSSTPTIALNEHRSLPYEIPTNILMRCKEMESKTCLRVAGGFPEIFQPRDTTCGRCKSVLNGPRIHSGGKGEGLIISELTPFKTVQVRVKYCSNKECQAMHQPSLHEYGKCLLVL